MRVLDQVLQNWRARMARPWIPSGARVLDIGCHQGEFLHSLGKHIRPSIGLDPLARPDRACRHWLLCQPFAEPLAFADAAFDVVVMLAAFEHIHDRAPLCRECYRLLRPGGRVIVTVPSPRVDGILAVLCSLRLADGMSLEEHHGFDPRTTPELFLHMGFLLEHRHRFQFGLNHLFVFRKPDAASVTRTAEGNLRLREESLAYA
jgi:SAM-dependent methyltransferase